MPTYAIKVILSPGSTETWYKLDGKKFTSTDLIEVHKERNRMASLFPCTHYIVMSIDNAD